MPFAQRNAPVVANPILIQNKDIDKYKTQSYIVIGLKHEEEPMLPSGRLFVFFCGLARNRCPVQVGFPFRLSRQSALPVSHPPTFWRTGRAFFLLAAPSGVSLIPLLPASRLATRRSRLARRALGGLRSTVERTRLRRRMIFGVTATFWAVGGGGVEAEPTERNAQ